MPGPDFYIGTISMFTGTFAPRQWVECNGALLPKAGNEALYSIIENIYGGDGKKTFALPNLQARFPLGLEKSNVGLGKSGGSFNITIPPDALPAHSHGLTVSDSLGEEDSGENAIFATASSQFPTQIYAPYDPESIQTLDNNTIANSGSGQQFTHYPRVTTVRYCICVQGLYPPRP